MAGLALLAAFLAQALMVQFGKIAEKEIALRKPVHRTQTVQPAICGSALENMSQGLSFSIGGLCRHSNAYRYATIYGLDLLRSGWETLARKIL